MNQKAIFLDRDGTIIEDQHYPRDANGVQLIAHATEGLKRLQEAGFLLFIVSNQSGVGRGIIKHEQFEAVHQRFCQLLQEENIHITDFAYCLHRPDENCACRKPSPALLEELSTRYKVDGSKSFTIGDKACDVDMADPIGATGYLVLTGKGLVERESLAQRRAHLHIALDLQDFARQILEGK